MNFVTFIVKASLAPTSIFMPFFVGSLWFSSHTAISLAYVVPFSGSVRSKMDTLVSPVLVPIGGSVVG